MYRNISGGANVSYGDIADGQTVVHEIPYTVPGDAVCGSFHQVMVNVSSDVGAQAPVEREFRLGAPVGGPAQTFENMTLINVPAGQPGTTSGPAGPYPSTISVAGVSGTKVMEVELTTVNHTWISDIDVLLEGPGGQKYIMFSDAFGSSNRTNTVVTTFKLRDDADATAPSTGVPSGPALTYRPTNHGANDPFAAPAPAGPYENAAPGGSATFESVFGTDGSAMNGDWKLWVVDDAAGDPGTIAGWKITFESDDYACSLAVTANGRADFDGDGRTDVSVFRGSEGNWYINQSTDGFMALNWGLASDILAPADYDNDGKTDTAIFRGTADETQPDFYILNSNGFTVSGYSWGRPGDVPVVADYDGDGKADVGVYRASSGEWYIIKSSDGGNIIVTNPGDTPVPGDYDGDGMADGIMFTNGTWTGTLSGGGSMNATFGQAGDIPVPGHYDNDNKVDMAVYRPSIGTWFILRTEDAQTIEIPFGVSTDIPVPGDYDGDGRDDVAVYRGGTWWIFGSTGNILISGIPANYRPGQIIPITVTVNQSDAVIYGFQLTAIDRNGGRVGSYTLPGGGSATLQIDTGFVNNIERRYVSHTVNGTTPIEFGTKSWTFNWTAPSQRVGKIGFYAAGNAANSDGGPGGDYIYTRAAAALSGSALSNFDSDILSDLAVYRPSTGVWYALNSTDGGFQSVQFGAEGDVIAPGDYDGDGITDRAVFRPSTGVWYIMKSTGGFIITQFGSNGDVPVPGDYDGDLKADLAIWRPSTGVWYVVRSSNGSFDIRQFGISTDKPTQGDFDGDGKTDLAVWRPSSGVWYIWRSTDSGYSIFTFGLSGDKPVQADFDGDGRHDAAVFRPSDGVWYMLRSSDGFAASQFGFGTDIPSPADFDGDGRADIAVYRDGIWYVYRSSDSGYTIVNFGIPGDRPIPAGYIPD
jgi:subtilisin-like proprotein convertase family protein